MTSCDPHMPVSVYPSPCHFPALICESLRVVLAVLSGFSRKQEQISWSGQDQVSWLPGQHAQMQSYEGGGGSPVTKLADEACDLFKGTPKSQHENELELRIKRETKAQVDH